MTAWAVVIGNERLEAERLFHHDTLELSGLEDGLRPSPGDQALVVAEGAPPLVVALGRVTSVSVEGRDPDDPQSDGEAELLAVTYTRRAFDEPFPADRLVLAGHLTPLDDATFGALAARLGPPPPNTTWLVSLDMPIEASTPAEAVRIFWSYVMELGPRELPAFVSPASDELAMQAFVLGEEANQDPEEDD
jgi:hypothetical protein